MKRITRKIISSVSHVSSLDDLIKHSGRNFILPFYHVVSDHNLPHLKHLYPVISTERFRQDLDFLLYHYKPVDTSFLPSYLSGNNERAFLLSFDDGLREFYEIAAPILQEKGIPAICFVNSAFVDNKAMFYRLKASILIESAQRNKIAEAQKKELARIFGMYNLKYERPNDFLKIKYHQQELLMQAADCLEISFSEYLYKYKPYMTSEQIKELQDKGFFIGGHSVDHPFYKDLSENEQVKETLDCMDFINEKFHSDKQLFSFPFSDFGIKKSFFEQIQNKIDFTFGTANLKEDAIKTNFQRIPMEMKGSKNAESIIKLEYLNYIIKKRLGKNIINRD